MQVPHMRPGDERQSRLPVRIWLAASLALAGFTTSCQGPEFYEKRNLASGVMDLAGSGTETHFYQKVYYSMEGSAGGIGTSAGGGCGCY